MEYRKLVNFTKEQKIEQKSQIFEYEPQKWRFFNFAKIKTNLQRGKALNVLEKILKHKIKFCLCSLSLPSLLHAKQEKFLILKNLTNKEHF